MPSILQNKAFPERSALLLESGRRDLLSAAEERLTGDLPVWEKRLLARDLIAVFGPVIEKLLCGAGDRKSVV